MTHLIQLFRHNQMWKIKDTDPETKRVFGSDVVITEFHDQILPQTILMVMKQRYPKKNILLRRETINSLESI